jgi:hypothetical protein
MRPMTRTTATPNSQKQPTKIKGLPSEPTDTERDAALKAAGIKGIKFTPIQLHAFPLKLVLEDGITAKQISLITETYRDLVKDYWGKVISNRAQMASPHIGMSQSIAWALSTLTSRK